MRFSSLLALNFYRFLTFFLAPIGAAFLCYKKRRDPPYGKRVFELLGYYPYELEDCIWFHAASVGEINSLKPLILKFQHCYPDKRVLITTMTTTGNIAAQAIADAYTVFMPLDSPCAVRRFFKNFKPKFLFIVDTELWPNMLQAAKKNNCKVIIVNGRMQEKSCQNYLKFKDMVADIIAAPLYKVLCIATEDAERFERIGIAQDKIKVSGNIKYDLNLSFEPFEKGRTLKADFKAPALCCASTHDGEENICIETFKALKQELPNLKLVLVPRHKTGVELFEKALNEQKIAYIRKSLISDPKAYHEHDVIIGDTMGEMSFYFGLCDLVFMGGSFVDIGGHNPLEPAFYSLPTITGPIYRNFKEQFTRLIEKGGAFVTSDQKEFTQTALKLLKSPENLQHAGEQALEVLKLGRGSTQRILDEIKLDLDAKP